jgi:hypothetical protein
MSGTSLSGEQWIAASVAFFGVLRTAIWFGDRLWKRPEEVPQLIQAELSALLAAMTQCMNAHAQTHAVLQQMMEWQKAHAEIANDRHQETMRTLNSGARRR